MKNKIGAVLQARMGSSRLPGKVLKYLGNKTMLEWIIIRLKHSQYCDEIIVATSNEPQDQPIQSLCKQLKIKCFLGSEHDVLDRYYHAAVAHKLTHILRITGDCPFTDPELVDNVITAFINSDEEPDFAANNFIRHYPRGTDIAMMKFSALERAWHEAKHEFERVHVTPYIRNHPKLFKLLSIEGDLNYGHMRWTVDTTEDFEFAKQVYRHLSDKQFSWKSILNIIHKHPDLTKINSHIIQKQLHEL